MTKELTSTSVVSQTPPPAPAATLGTTCSRGRRDQAPEQECWDGGTVNDKRWTGSSEPRGDRWQGSGQAPRAVRAEAGHGGGRELGRGPLGPLRAAEGPPTAPLPPLPAPESRAASLAPLTWGRQAGRTSELVLLGSLACLGFDSTTGSEFLLLCFNFNLL